MKLNERLGEIIKEYKEYLSNFIFENIPLYKYEKTRFQEENYKENLFRIKPIRVRGNDFCYMKEQFFQTTFKDLDIYEELEELFEIINTNLNYYTLDCMIDDYCEKYHNVKTPKEVILEKIENYFQMDEDYVKNFIKRNKKYFDFDTINLNQNNLAERFIDYSEKLAFNDRIIYEHIEDDFDDNRDALKNAIERYFNID